MPSILMESAAKWIKAIEAGFLFRKLGLCYDYRAPEGEFPRKTLPTSKEVRENLPNTTGKGTGMQSSWYAGALLFDAMLLRLEYGFALPEEERLFDRLIGGLIRLGTMGNRGTLIRGLAPDGRSAYPDIDGDVHLFWGFHAWRAYTTAAIAMESQEKLNNISSKWIQRLIKDDFALDRVTGDADTTLLQLDSENGPKLLAILAAARTLSGDDKLDALFLSKRDEADGVRIKGDLPADARTPSRLLAVQIAWQLLRECAPDEALREAAVRQMKTIASEAVQFLQAETPIDTTVLEQAPDLDWRNATDTSFATLPEDWARIPHENEAIVSRLQAGLTILMARDEELSKMHAATLEKLLTDTPADQLWLSSSVALALGCHAHGVEQGLWDETLKEYTHSFDGQANLGDKYMVENYDEEHPEQAGHIKSCRKKEEPIQDEKTDKKKGRGRSGNRGGKRRRRRKKRGPKKES